MLLRRQQLVLQQQLVLRHDAQLQDYVAGERPLPPALRPLCERLELLQLPRSGTELCRLAELADMGAAARAAAAAYAPPAALLLLPAAPQTAAAPRCPADGARQLLLKLLAKSRQTSTAPLLRDGLTLACLWVGDDYGAISALRLCCSSAAACGLRRLLKSKLRSGRCAQTASLAELLPRLRVAPQRADLWTRALQQLRVHCLGAESTTEARRAAVAAAWSREAQCRTCDDRREAQGHFCLRCARQNDRPAYDASSLASQGRPLSLDLAMQRCDPSAELWALETPSAGVVVHCTPEELCPLMALLRAMHDEAQRAGLVGQRFSHARLLPLLPMLRRVAPGLAQALPQGEEALDRFLEATQLLAAPALLRHQARLGAEEAPPLLWSALTQTHEGARQLDLLRVLGARAPRALALETGPEAEEELRRISQDPTTRQRLALRAALQRAGAHAARLRVPRAQPLGSAGKLRRDLVHPLLRAEECLATLLQAGRWSFDVAVESASPALAQQRVRGATDDDPRPRPAPHLLPSSFQSLEAREEAQQDWVLACLHQPPTWQRARRLLAAARGADASRVAASRASVFLSPQLLGAPEVPLQGPNQVQAARPLGKSQFYHWRPRADARLAPEGDAQMQNVHEALDAQERAVQTVGRLKKDAVAELAPLHQRGGHLCGEPVLSPLCQEHPEPRAALWCGCARPRQHCGPGLLCERWNVPGDYAAQACWRSGQSLPKEEDREVRVAAGPATLATLVAPAEPSGAGLREALLAALAADDPLWVDALVRVAGADGVWWAWSAQTGLRRASDLGLCLAARRERGLKLPPGASLLLPPGASVPETATTALRRLQPGFLRRDACEAPGERLYSRADGVCREDAGGRAAPGQLLFAAAPGRTPAQRMVRRGALLRCTGTSLSVRPAPSAAEGAAPHHSPATAFELALRFPGGAAAELARAASPVLSGHCAREKFCRACHLPVLHACERCAGPGEPWCCWQCGLLRHLAVTTTLGAEHWVCASCGAAEAQPRRSRRGRRAPPSDARPPRPGRQGSAHQVRPTRGRSRGAPAARHAAPRRSKSRRKRRAAAGRPLGSRDRQPTAAPAGPATPRRRPGQARPAPSSAHAWGRPGASPLRAPMIEESDAASQSRALAQRDSLQNKTSLILSERLKSIINKRLIYNSRRGLFRRSRRERLKSRKQRRQRCSSGANSWLTENDG